VTLLASQCYHSKHTVLLIQVIAVYVLTHCHYYCLHRTSGLGCVAGLLLAVCISICTLLLIIVASVLSVGVGLILMAVVLLAVVVTQLWRVNFVKWSVPLPVNRRSTHVRCVLLCHFPCSCKIILLLQQPQRCTPISNAVAITALRILMDVYSLVQ
jgi:hypothetical protein